MGQTGMGVRPRVALGLRRGDTAGGVHLVVGRVEGALLGSRVGVREGDEDGTAVGRRLGLGMTGLGWGWG